MKNIPNNDSISKDFPPSGFAGLSRRVDSLKPVIAAVNGLAIGISFNS